MNPPPNQVLFSLLTGAWVTKSLGVVTELGIPDHLSAGPRTATSLAAEVGAQPAELYRILRMLAGVGVFHEGENQTFSLTPVSELLCQSHPHSMHSLTRALLFGEHWNAWSRLLDVVRHGGIATDLAEGHDIWEHYRLHPERAAIFDQAMVDFTIQSAAAVIPAYEFQQFQTVCDIGGGHGALLIAILNAYPHLHGILFDQDYVVEAGRQRLAEHSLSHRTTTVGGNFFESVAPVADLYLAKNIIHDWDDEKSITILRNIRKVIPPSGKLLLLEVMVGPPNVPDPGKFMDINMLAMTGGQERTAGQFAALFTASGFTLGRVIPTASPVFLIEGLPA